MTRPRDLILECMRSAADIVLVAVWQNHRRVASYRDFNGCRRAVAVNGYATVERCGACLDVLQVADEGGGYEQVAHAVRARFVVYAAECLEQPFVYLSHHEMVPRRALSRIPLLRQCRCAVFQLETVSRCFIMVEHGV